MRRIVVLSADPGFPEGQGGTVERRGTSFVRVPEAPLLRDYVERVTPNLIVVDGTTRSGRLGQGLDVVRAHTNPAATALLVVVDQGNEGALPAWVRTRARAQVLLSPVQLDDVLRVSARLTGSPSRRRGTLPVRIEVPAWSQAVRGAAFNLSVGGMGVLLAGEPLPAAGEVLVCFRLPGGRGDCALRAEVRRVEPDPQGHRHGLQFIEISEALHRRIDDFVRSGG